MFKDKETEGVDMTFYDLPLYLQLGAGVLTVFTFLWSVSCIMAGVYELICLLKGK